MTPLKLLLIFITFITAISIWIAILNERFRVITDINLLRHSFGREEEIIRVVKNWFENLKPSAYSIKMLRMCQSIGMLGILGALIWCIIEYITV